MKNAILMTSLAVLLSAAVLWAMVEYAGLSLSKVLAGLLFTAVLAVIGYFLYLRIWSEPDPLHGIEAMSKLADQQKLEDD